MKVARTAPQGSDAPREAVAAAVPAAACIWSSAISFVLGSLGTNALIWTPFGAVKVSTSAVATAPSNRSPLAVVVAFPLLGDVLVPCADAVTSSEFAVATPVYSKIAKRNEPEIVSDTVIVLAPAEMFSA